MERFYVCPTTRAMILLTDAKKLTDCMVDYYLLQAIRKWEHERNRQKAG